MSPVSDDSPPAAWGRGGRQLQREAASLAKLAGDVDPAAMLLEYLLAHRQTEARATAPLARHEHAEDLLLILLGDAAAVVNHVDQRQPLVVAILCGDLYRTVLSVVAGVHRVGDDVENRPVHCLGIEHQRGHRRVGLQNELDALVLGAGLHHFHDVSDDLVQIGRLGDRLALLTEREHVEHQGRDAFLVLLDDSPALAHDGHRLLGRRDVNVAVVDRLGMILHAHLDQVAAAAHALQDVLDVVR